MTAVTLDSTGSPNFVTGGFNLSCQITISASATSLLVWLTFSTAPGFMTVSWNSSTQFLTQLTTANSTGSNVGHLWGLLSPAAAVNTLVRATWSNAANATLNAVSFFNTPTDTLANCFQNVTTASSVGQLPKITVTSQTSDMAVGVFGSSATIDSVDNTKIYILNTGTTKSAANNANGAASITLGSSTGTSAVWVSMGVDVFAAAAVSGIVPFQTPSWAALPTKYSFIGT